MRTIFLLTTAVSAFIAGIAAAQSPESLHTPTATVEMVQLTEGENPVVETLAPTTEAEKTIPAIEAEVATAHVNAVATLQVEPAVRTMSSDPAYTLLKFPIMSSFKPARTVLIAFGNDSIKELGEGSVDALPGNKFIAQFSIKKSDLSPSSLLTALVFSQEGETEGTPLISYESMQKLEIPACPLKKRAEFQQATLQPGVVQSLVQVRIDRRKNAQERLQQLLSGEFLDTVIRLERGFGLSKENPISPNLDPVELIERLSHITAATQSYKGHRKLG